MELVYSLAEQTLASYQYAYDPAGNRVQSSENVLWPLADYTPPNQFSAVEQGYLAVSLAWPDSSIEEEGYTLERSAMSTTGWRGTRPTGIA